MTHKGFLNSDEINTLVFSCFEYGPNSPIFSPGVPLTQNIHEVPRFVKEQKTVGFSVKRSVEVYYMQFSLKANYFLYIDFRYIAVITYIHLGFISMIYLSVFFYWLSICGVGWWCI